MPVIIREITSEVALQPEERPAETGPAPGTPAAGDAAEQLVQQAVRRVMEILRREQEP